MSLIHKSLKTSVKDEETLCNPSFVVERDYILNIVSFFLFEL